MFFDRRALELEWFLKNELNRTRTQPVHDPAGVYWRHNSNTGDLGAVNVNCTVKYGTIIESFPHLHCYRVQSEADSVVLCSFAGRTSFMPFGAKEIQLLIPGTNVFYAQHPATMQHVILGVDPPFMARAQLLRSDYISQGSRVGLARDLTHGYAATFPHTELVNYSAGRPIDGTAGGEWGVVTETGMTLVVDPFMSQFRLDEETGLFIFYHDQMTRLAGHNLQIRSAGHDFEAFDDENEFNIINGIAPYIWEALGTYRPTQAESQPLKVEIPQAAVQSVLPHYGIVEPAFNDQQAFHRYVEFFGYLGQGFKKVLRLPPPINPFGWLGAPLERFSTQSKYFGVWEEDLLLTGRYLMSTSKGLMIAKRPFKPSPKQMARPEDGNADVANIDIPGAQYMAASAYGQNLPHKVKGQFRLSQFGTTPLPAMIHAAGLLDEAAENFNWQATHPFYYHALDWYLPEEGDLFFPNATGTTAGNPPKSNATAQWEVPYHKLKEFHYLDPPIPMQVKVDHRYGLVDYYQTNAYFAMLEDGSVVISDGYESECIMAGGAIHLIAPGDLWLRAGRNIIGWAGNDIVMRARDSMDFTTTRKDIRLKAEQNLQVVAGNNGKGGILLESWADCIIDPELAEHEKIGEDARHSGIIIKAPKSQIAVVGQHLFLESGYWHDNEDDPRPGNIHIDAHDQRVRIRGKYYEQFIVSEGAMTHVFSKETGSDVDEQEIIKVHEYWADNVILCANVAIKGSMTATGCIFSGNNMLAKNHIYTGQADSKTNKVTQLTSADSTNLNSNVTYTDTRCTNNKNYGQTEYDKLDEYKNGAFVDFTFRTVHQMGTYNFGMYESRWQQAARLIGKVQVEWGEEPDVVAYEPEKKADCPYPGTIYLAPPDIDPPVGDKKDVYYTLDLAFFDINQGYAKSRLTSPPYDYEDPEFKKPDELSLALYPVIPTKNQLTGEED